MPQRGKRTYHYFILVFLLLLPCGIMAQESQQDSTNLSVERLFNEAKKIRYQNPDSSIILLQTVHEQSLRTGDTLLAVNALLEMPFIYGQRVNYAKSYDVLWRALFLADELGDNILKASIYDRLGRLYSFFKRKENAFYYLQTSLKIKQDLVDQGLLDKSQLVKNYYSICATYRELNDPIMGRIYLDSCLANITNAASHLDRFYIQFEKAFILSKEGKNIEALQLMEEIEPWFKKNRPSYLVLIYTYWGDIYTGLSNPTESQKKYKMALQISEKYDSHLDFTPLIYDRLAAIYLKEGDYQKAFTNQQKAKELDGQIFDSRSENNMPLLEIKDEFRQEKERQAILIQKQRLEKLEQEDKISLLQRTILLGTIVFLVIIGFIYFKTIRSKHNSEKQLIRRSKELEIQKAEELLELKNKELATSALQLVEKDEFLRELKSKLKKNIGNINNPEINQVLKSISHSNNNNWEEFKLRFTAVNERFYKKVTTEYPNLSQADQRICALIKLNFSSKEMAKLLGISVESVHTTRYRLRKKMGLPRSINLEEFIAAL
ncbi:MAG: hypothetical protein WBM53_14520 [Maribacter sp.]